MILNKNEMQSEMADFAPGADTWWTGRYFIRAHSLHHVKKWRHPQNRKYITYWTAVRGGPSHGNR